MGWYWPNGFSYLRPSSLADRISLASDWSFSILDTIKAHIYFRTYPDNFAYMHWDQEFFLQHYSYSKGVFFYRQNIVLHVLIHIFVLSYWISTRSYDVYYTFWDIFTFYSGIIVLVLFFGFLMTVCVELPFSNLLKNGMQKFMKKNEDRGLQERGKGESILTAN